MHQRHTERAGAARPRAGRRERQGGAEKQGSGIITTDEARAKLNLAPLVTPSGVEATGTLSLPAAQDN